MANLDLTVGSLYRPTIDGVISRTNAELFDWSGTEYESFTLLEMYVNGNPTTNKPYVANAYIAYDCQNKILCKFYQRTPPPGVGILRCGTGVKHTVEHQCHHNKCTYVCAMMMAIECGNVRMPNEVVCGCDGAGCARPHMLSRAHTPACVGACV